MKANAYTHKQDDTEDAAMDITYVQMMHNFGKHWTKRTQDLY